MSEAPPVEILVEALPLPLLVFGPDRRLLFANAALRAFASARPDHLKPGTPAEEVARFLAYRGLLGVGDPAALAAEAAAAEASRAATSARAGRRVGSARAVASARRRVRDMAIPPATAFSSSPAMVPPRFAI